MGKKGEKDRIAEQFQTSFIRNEGIPSRYRLPSERCRKANADWPEDLILYAFKT